MKNTWVDVGLLNEHRLESYKQFLGSGFSRTDIVRHCLDKFFEALTKCGVPLVCQDCVHWHDEMTFCELSRRVVRPSTGICQLRRDEVQLHFLSLHAEE